ncbi:uncharacterized protein TNCV_4702051 [Trichonephila clavipes]|uniref:Uncharacterized protein n=1 Tax=Trichonephila clavipes TaxID=2585209 RepID=A0A8X6WI33_TRICX|nr:uncharacterized protein TNCV_4702051 [Trichonephila clavipes]
MAPGIRCMSGNTCGSRMSWIYHWAVRVPRINTRSDCVLRAMAPHTITPAVGAVFRCKTKAGLRRSPRGLHTQTRWSSLLRLNLNSSLKTTWFHSATVLFTRLQTEVSMDRRQGSTRNGRRYLKCPSARRVRKV